MTPHAHHNNDLYLSAYRAELTRDLTDAHNADGNGRNGLRLLIAQLFVRFGAWLLPGTPELVDGRILVLDIGGADPGHQRAA